MILHSKSNANGKAMKPWGFETLNNKRLKTSVRGCNVFTKTMVSKTLAKISALRIPRSSLCIEILDKENNDDSKSFGPQFWNGNLSPNLYLILPLFKTYLEESKFAIYWIRLRPNMNTTITIFNTSKPCYRLRTKVIGRNISLTQTDD